MHAIVRQGNGKYYISPVFGYYKNFESDDKHRNIQKSAGKPHYIVWNPEKNRLIRCEKWTPNTLYLIPQILIVESKHDNWIINEDGEGCVDFLNRELLGSIIDAEDQPERILKKCTETDKGYIYDETPEIKTLSDIENLEWASGGFHDARIIKEELLADGTLHLRFDGTWGCEIEVWFWGDLEYDTSSRNPEEYDPYWFGSTIILQDGFVYFIDDDNMTVEKINSSYCYFKARHMKYHIIPE